MLRHTRPTLFLFILVFTAVALRKTLLIHYKICLVDKRKTPKNALREMKYYDLLYCILEGLKNQKNALVNCFSQKLISSVLAL